MTDITARPRCRTCGHWWPAIPSDAMGQCRALPPPLANTMDGRWPYTHALDGCGAHRPEPVAA